MGVDVCRRGRRKRRSFESTEVSQRESITATKIRGFTSRNLKLKSLIQSIRMTPKCWRRHVRTREKKRKRRGLATDRKKSVVLNFRLREACSATQWPSTTFQRERERCFYVSPMTRILMRFVEFEFIFSVRVRDATTVIKRTDRERERERSQIRIRIT